ncbi:hypothetical protein BDD43_1521 [Mucilaginibacter gracilis]|uniref:Uncharacterized protein n=1 Tax=Mucilaginibacter gracilis TaxID=423350 RepID=A0A495IXH5_9SPHI|nr:hypothetical protein [Mucilaginibacter gracilis]RKR81375.1 hypothetical protein BDD43_1521 [Mucilaginibacter gracilis]
MRETPVADGYRGFLCAIVTGTLLSTHSWPFYRRLQNKTFRDAQYTYRFGLAISKLAVGSYNRAF